MPLKTKRILADSIAEMMKEAPEAPRESKPNPARRLVGSRPGRRGHLAAYIVHSDGKYGRKS